jgi:phosphoribosyl 1,2-cyclic phosphodiesterase
MSISFCVLGSGSGGNCTLLRLNAGGGCRHVLIDAGLSPRNTAARLAGLGVRIEDIDDVLLTHVDTDHLHSGWIDVADPPPVTFRAHSRHIGRAIRAGIPVSRTAAFDDSFELDASTRVEISTLPHDQLGSTGFVIDHAGVRLGFVTDLGRVDESLMNRFVRLDALAIESNYDADLQRASARPAALKRRIMGGLGHLSNDQSLEAVLRMDKACVLAHVVLLHLSRQCNTPQIVRSLYAQRAPHLLGRLTITNQREPTPVLHVAPATGRAAPSIVVGAQLNFLEGLPGPPR